LNDILAGHRAEIATRHRLGDGADPIRQLALALPEIERLQRVELNDLALVVERGGDRAKAAEHPLASEFAVQHVQMQHAVEQRHNRRPRSDRRRKRLDRIVEIEALQLNKTTSNFSLS